jgi:zinc protease
LRRTDRTNYFEDVPTNALGYTLWMESDRMGHLLGTLDQKTLDLQRGVVQNEKRQGENQPYGVTRELIAHNTYPAGHPYSWTTIGDMAVTREDLVQFHDTWYHPNNATLVILGDTRLAEIKPKLEKLFADWKPAQVPKKNVSAVSLSPKPTVYLIDKPGALQSVIIAGIVAPPQVNPKEIAMEAMNDDFGGMFASRLNLNLREDKHWSCWLCRSGPWRRFFPSRRYSDRVRARCRQTSGARIDARNPFCQASRFSSRRDTRRSRRRWAPCGLRGRSA